MEDLDHMRETFLLVASLFVMMNMASKILSLCAGSIAEMEAETPICIPMYI